MLDKTERMNELLDWYESQLTDKQKEIVDLYYREDLSLSEISEHTKTSRSAVHDAIKRCEIVLEKLESQLSIVKRYQMRLKYYGMLRDLKIDAVDEIVSLLEKCDE